MRQKEKLRQRRTEGKGRDGDKKEIKVVRNKTAMLNADQIVGRRDRREG